MGAVHYGGRQESPGYLPEFLWHQSSRGAGNCNGVGFGYPFSLSGIDGAKLPLFIWLD